MNFWNNMRLVYVNEHIMTHAQYNTWTIVQASNWPERGVWRRWRAGEWRWRSQPATAADTWPRPQRRWCRLHSQPAPRSSASWQPANSVLPLRQHHYGNGPTVLPLTFPSAVIFCNLVQAQPTVTFEKHFLPLEAEPFGVDEAGTGSDHQFCQVVMPIMARDVTDVCNTQNGREHDQRQCFSRVVNKCTYDVAQIRSRC